MASTVLPNGIIIPEKYSRDWYNDLYHNWQELDNLLGGGTPKDGTLTIQKNGDTVGTFSANQATDETINIEVPDVNDATLTIQKNGTDVATFSANSSTNATANITVPTKTSDLTNDSGFITEDNTKIPLAGSNQISGDLIPSTDGTVNLGSASYRWNNAYATTFNGNVVSNGTLTLQSNSGTARILLRNNNSPKFPSSVNLYSKVDNVEYGVFLEGNRFYPTIDGEINFGYLQRRWKDCNTKAINGLNPGALSLPGDAYIDIDTTNYAWGRNFTFTPDYDGYCWIGVGSSSYSRTISLKTGRGEYYFSNQTNIFRFTFPVYKGKLVTIMTASSGTESVIPTIRVFSCQGNV